MLIEVLQVLLEVLGYKVKIVDLNSGLYGIQVMFIGYFGGVDFRCEGVVVGKQCYLWILFYV